MQGTMIFYNETRGFGFIRHDESEENLFLHITKCNDIPENGSRVQYAVAEGRKGLEAVNVSII